MEQTQKEAIILLKARLDIVEGALLHIVNALDEKKQKSIRQRLKDTKTS